MPRYIDIPIFGGGLVTNADLEDIPKDAASSSLNVDIDVPGKIKKRKPRQQAHVISGSQFSRFINWVAPKGGSYWIGHETQNDKIELKNYNFGVEFLESAVSADVSTVKFVNFGDDVRIANGIEEKADYVSQNTRRFFFDFWKPAVASLIDSGADLDESGNINDSVTTINIDGTLNVQVGDYILLDSEVMLITAMPDEDTLTVKRAQIGTSAASHNDNVQINFPNTFFMGNAECAYPATWTYQDASNESYAHGTNATGFYYYKFAPIFDGNQEAPLVDGFIKYNLTTANRPIKVGVKLSTNDFNRRITGINLYKSYLSTDHTPVYQKAKTISVNTTIDSTDFLRVSAGKVGNVIYDSTGSFTSSSIAGKWIKLHASSINQAYYVAQRYGDNAIRVSKRYNTSTSALDPSTFAGIAETGWADANGYQIFADDGSTNAPTGSATSTVSTSKLYYGLNTVYDATYAFDNDEKQNWISVISSTPRLVLNSYDNIIKLSSNATYSTGVQNDISNGYYYDTSGTDVTLYAYDSGLIESGLHPLGSVDKTTVNYKYAQYVNGRLFAGNVRLDPDTAAEDHPNWIIYSELNQPDILPITNYIQVKDEQGGAITGLQMIFNDLAVFMERGVFRLSVPPTNPANWFMLEAHENIGCIAPDSIVKAGQFVFFAGSDHIYMLDSNFNITAVTEPIEDEYQAASSLESTRAIYDPKKNRVLFLFGSSTRYLYSIDLLQINSKLIWNKHDLSSTSTLAANNLVIDKDSNVYTVANT